MCGRFTQNYSWEEVHAFLSVFGPPRNLQPHYNIAPTDTVDVIRLDKHGGREFVPMRWGLVPAWWKKSLKEVPATFNARAESVDEQPHLFTAADDSPLLAFAGLWDRWKDPPTGEWLLSCTIIVSGASAWMEPYHDRVPVLLEAKDFDGWLDGSLGTEVLKPAPAEALREWKVSPRLNRTGVGDDDPTIIEPIGN
jgi:putative SOS response-associated peptidase YedK